MKRKASNLIYFRNMGSEPLDEEDALIDDYMERRERAVASQTQEVRRTVDKKEAAKRRETYWALSLFLLLAGSIYLFWILPNQIGSQEVRVKFEKKK